MTDEAPDRNGGEPHPPAGNPAAPEVRPQALSAEALWRVGVPVALIKVTLLLVVYLSIELLHPSLFRKQAYRENFHWPPGARPTVESHFKTWDGQHYLFLAEFGYKKGMPSTAFYPLWPLLVRIGALPLGGNFLLSALLLGNLFSLLGFLFLHAIVKSDHGERIADASTLLLLVFPGSLFLLFPYTESLFLFLGVLFFYFLRRENLWAAGIVAFLLPLTRAVGVFIALPFAYELFLRYRREKNRPLSLNLRDLGLLSLPAFGWATYFLVLYLTTGNAFEGFGAQDGYIAKRSVANLVDLKLLLTNFLDVGSLHGFLDSAIDRFWFVLLLAVLYPIWRLDRGYFFFCLGTGILPAMTGSFLSYTRFFLLVFPVFIVLGKLLANEKARGLKWASLALLFTLQLLFLLRHSNNFWVG